jgi:hypothetical protein
MEQSGSAGSPKTGARTRDAWGQLAGSVEQEETVRQEEQQTAETVRGLQQCREEVARNVVWPGSSRGSVSSTDCPTHTAGRAVRECTEDGWARPDLGQCRALWLSDLTTSYRGGGSLTGLSSSLSHSILTAPLYGGDLLTLCHLIQTSVRSVQLHTATDQSPAASQTFLQVLQHFSHVLSHLLDWKALPAWLDLSPIELEVQRTRFLGLLHQLGEVALHTTTRDTVLITTHNFGKSNTPQRKLYVQYFV